MWFARGEYIPRSLPLQIGARDLAKIWISTSPCGLLTTLFSSTSISWLQKAGGKMSQLILKENFHGSYGRFGKLGMHFALSARVWPQSRFSVRQSKTLPAGFTLRLRSQIISLVCDKVQYWWKDGNLIPGTWYRSMSVPHGMVILLSVELHGLTVIRKIRLFLIVDDLTQG